MVSEYRWVVNHIFPSLMITFRDCFFFFSFFFFLLLFLLNFISWKIATILIISHTRLYIKDPPPL
jgi:hypothetical protein